MTLASLLPWKRVKPADPMQEVPSDEAPTLKEMTAVAETYRKSCISWRERAQRAETELARLKAGRERSNAALSAANAKRRADALAKANPVAADREAA
jgi:hypothetical protein